jgi:hypothetical protein
LDIHYTQYKHSAILHNHATTIHPTTVVQQNNIYIDSVPRDETFRSSPSDTLSYSTRAQSTNKRTGFNLMNAARRLGALARLRIVYQRYEYFELLDGNEEQSSVFYVMNRTLVVSF